MCANYHQAVKMSLIWNLSYILVLCHILQGASLTTNNFWLEREQQWSIKYKITNLESWSCWKEPTIKELNALPMDISVSLPAKSMIDVVD